MSYISGILAKITSMANALRESEQKVRDQAKELEQKLMASGRLVSPGEVTASMAYEFYPLASSRDSLPALEI